MIHLILCASEDQGRVPSLPGFLSAFLPAVPDLCHYPSEAQQCPRCLHAHLQSVTSVIMPWRHNRSDEGAQGPEEESAGASQAAPATQSTRKDPLARKASMLVEFLLEKDTKKEPIMQNALLTVINRKYRQHFSEILRRASERMELVFGLELKEVNHSRNIYVLISKLSLGGDEGPNDEKGCPSLVSPWCSWGSSS
uniref:Uncharacterized protein n=2 Tax=Ovis aries TaxID=9940 RepID=A0AC11BM06_SHEEP